MAFFRYQALDSEGKEMNGTMNASSAQEVFSHLQTRGLSPKQVVPSTDNSWQTVPAVRSQVQSVPFRNSSTVRAEIPQQAKYTPSKPIIKTKLATDKALFYFFSQLQSLLNAGISPSEAMNSLASRVPQKELQEAARNIAKSSSSGESLSSEMERYPYLFSPHAVGTMRAGEMAGFLPEACGDLADFYQESSSFKRMWWMTRFITWQGILGFAYALPIFKVFFAVGAKSMESGGENLNMFKLILEGYTRIALYQVTPILLVLYGIFWVVRRQLSMPEAAMWRHAFSLRLPYGQAARVKAESISFFLRNLKRLYSAGVAPQTAWRLAALSTPNQVIAARLQSAGDVAGEKAGLADAVMRSGVFEPEYWGLMQTAQQTGDIVPALERMGSVFANEYQAENIKAKRGIGALGCLSFILSTGIIGLIMTHLYFQGTFAFMEKIAP